MDEAERLLHELARWAADDRTAGAARSRSAERWRRQQAGEEATFSGLALDLAESNARVTVLLRGGRSHGGTLAAVGADFLVVRAPAGPPVLVRLEAVACLRPAPGRAGDAASRRAPALEARLAHVLAGLAGDRPRVSVALDGVAEPVGGELRACGADVLTVLVPGAPPARAYLALHAVTDVTVLG